MEMQVKGLKEVNAKLERLGGVTGRRAMLSSLRTGAKPILAKAKANYAAIPTGSGALHIATRTVSLRDSEVAGGGKTRYAVAIAPKLSDRKAIVLANFFYKRRHGVRKIYWGHFIEWGFFSRKANRHIPGRHILQSAASAAAGQAVEAFRVAIGKNVNKALAKQGIE